MVQGWTPNHPRRPASIRRDPGSAHALSGVKTSAAARTPVYFAATGAAAASATATASRKVLKITHQLPCALYLAKRALVFTALSFAAPLSRIGARFGGLPTHGASVASVLLALGQTLPIAVHTRWPAACLAVTGTSFAVHECLGYPPTFGSLGLYIALYSVGAHQDRLRRVVPLAATGGYVVFGVVLHTCWAHPRA